MFSSSLSVQKDIFVLLHISRTMPISQYPAGGRIADAYWMHILDMLLLLGVDKALHSGLGKAKVSTESGDIFYFKN